MSSLPHAPWFLLGSLCLGTSCLYFVMVLLLGHSEDGRGQWEREGSSVLHKNDSRRKGNFLVYDPTFYHLCFSESWIRMFIQVSGVFFSESGGKFCRIEVRHFFPPKGGSRYVPPRRKEVLPLAPDHVLPCSFSLGEPSQPKLQALTVPVRIELMHGMLQSILKSGDTGRYSCARSQAQPNMGGSVCCCCCCRCCCFVRGRLVGPIETEGFWTFDLPYFARRVFVLFAHFARGISRPPIWWVTRDPAGVNVIKIYQEPSKKPSKDVNKKVVLILSHTTL